MSEVDSLLLELEGSSVDSDPVAALLSELQPEEALETASTFSNDDLPIINFETGEQDVSKYVNTNPQQEEGFDLANEFKGAGETALSAVTGATGGTAGMMIGTFKQIADELKSGQFGSQEAASRIEKEAMRMAGEFTYAPRTEKAQRNLEAFGEVAGMAAPLAGLTSQLNVISNSVRASSPIFKDLANKSAGKPNNNQPPEFLKLQERQGVGAEAQSDAQLRVATAENLPSPIQMTKGAAERSAQQLAFEKEVMKSPQFGEPLRIRAEENNLQALENFDALIDMTDAKAPDLSATGNNVIESLKQGYKQAKKSTADAYLAARKSKEAKAQINPEKIVFVGPDNDPIIGTPWDYLNSKPRGVDSSKVTDSAIATAKKLDLVDEDDTGKIIPKSNITVGQMEDFRREVSGMASFGDKTGLRDETILKNMIDAQTEQFAGDLYKKARALRTKQARKYENRAVVARLISKVRDMDDPKVSADMVFNKSILNSSPEEIQFLKRVLNTSSDDGPQAWKELQGATVRFIRDEATKSLNLDSNDNPVISPSRLHGAVTRLDSNGRLNLIFGNERAEIIRDLNDVVRYVKTTSPNTLVNNSGTTGMLLAAMAEAGGYTAATGVGVPLLSGLRFLKSGLKNKQIKKKVQEALDGLDTIK